MSEHSDFLSKAAPNADLAWILEKLGPVVSASHFKNERILLTGGTGFFGKWLTQTLIAMNDRLSLKNEITLVTRDRGRAENSLPWLRGRKDIRFSVGDIRGLTVQDRFTTIIHGAAAASAALNENRPEEMFDTIVEGTKRILSIAESGECKRFQLISSGGVYGPQPAGMTHIPEHYLGAPETLSPAAAYGEAKRAAEMLAAFAAKRSGFKLTIPRCFAFIGPYLPMDTHFAAGNFLNQVLRGETIQIGGDGTPHRSYLYAADLVVWLLEILLNEKSPVIVNVGSGESKSILQVAEAIHAAGCRVIPVRASLMNPIHVAKQAAPGAQPSRYVPDVEKARAELNLQAWTSLSEGAEKTLRWCRT